MLEPIRKQYREIANSLGVNRTMQTTAPKTGSGVHAEFENGTYFYVVTECAGCGHEPERQPTEDVEEFLWWFVRDLTYDLAHQWADEHRVERKDHRRLWYSKHVQILRQINDSWANMQKNAYNDALMRYPYDDAEQDRIDYMRQLQSDGLTLGEAYRRAETKFPEPKNV